MKTKRNIGQEILASIKEIQAWQRGDKKLKTTRILMPAAKGIANIRHTLKLSQQAFAAVMGVSVAALRNWERGRREPRLS